ncbi:hypothetical protein LY28_03760 [Ruminiclostridium sufflavum DSM 19573]|uniref:Uncharacterized protein n=1 Tax=Ruminiclostridium sufflavum DSM 19573 TaxID=1121337 RepID=A0A318XFE6_9FIRM|nr:hypothetical protein [Ruminiclostridium sufflavum]PYG83912.1 hypothetical protein LY28_03760 [Ruminiclostridium sufflavum DSM 19573]
MAFVNEKISKQDEDFFNSFNFKSPFTQNDSIKPWKWTINREREAFLTGLGGQGYEHSEIPEFFALVWKKKVIILETFSGGSGSNSTGVEVWWKITSIKVPQSLIVEKEAVMDLIKEAFEAYGNGYNSTYVRKVEIKFISEPYFIPRVE